MKRPSLIYQAKEILTELFSKGFGRSRHVDKRNNISNVYIYCRSTYKSTLQKCCTFLKYCREQYNVRYLVELKPEYFKEFIKSANSGSGYCWQTAKTYKSCVKKLQDGFNSINSAQFNWVDESYKEAVNQNISKIKGQMPSYVHDNIIKKAYEQKHVTGLAFDIARALGLRVSEITNLRMRDFSFKNGAFRSIHIHCSKGGRSRNIESRHLTKQQIETVVKVFEHFKGMRKYSSRLFTNKAGSYQKAFERIRDSVTDGYINCGIHSMRKEFAKSYFNREAEKGRNPKTVKKELTKLLGHNRLDVLGYYLK